MLHQHVAQVSQARFADLGLLVQPRIRIGGRLGALPAARGVLLIVRRRQAPAHTPPSRAAGTIRGLVVDARSASPLPGVLIRLRGTEVVSDADGRFEFPSLSVGTHRLYVSLVGYSLAEPEVTLTSESPLDVTVALADGAGTYTEEINVVGDRFRGAAASVPAAMVLSSADLRERRGVLRDDPFRTVQALPGRHDGQRPAERVLRPRQRFSPRRSFG